MTNSFQFARRFFRGLSILFLVVPTAAFPQAIDDEFEPADGIESIQRLEYMLASVGNDESAINEVRLAAQQLLARGSACAQAAVPKVEDLQSELEILGEPDPNEEIDIWEQRQNIAEQLARISGRKSNCELLVVRGEQLVRAADIQMATISSQRMWSRGPLFLSVLSGAFGSFKDFREGLAMTDTWEERFETSPRLTLSLAFFLALLAIAIALHLRHRFSTWAGRNGLDRGQATLIYLIPRPLAENGAVLLTGAVLSLFVHSISISPSLGLFAMRAPLALLLFGLGTVFIRWSTNPLSPAASIDGVERPLILSLRRRMRICLMVIVVGFAILGRDWLLTPPETGFLFVHTILSLSLAAGLLSVVLMARKVPSLRERFGLLRLGISGALIVAAIAGLIGYHNFSNYLLQGLLNSLLAVFFLWIALWMSGAAFKIISTGNSAISVKLRTLLGLTSTESESSLGLYNLVLDLVMWLVFLYVVANTWDTTGKFPSYVADKISDGFLIGTVNIIPAHIIYGLVAFATLMIVTGWVKRTIQRRYIQHTNMDRGARDALLKITGYVGFTLAILLGLKLTGISFTGLAFVGAALGVGIGFGLQNIVNNFLSGLILLFERPIKAGDFVTVGGVEGTVKQINIRSTEIETLDRQNVIVPNSELISQQVTNWVLHDPHGRLQILIGVAYGSDTEKVREVLRTVAEENPHVLNDGVNSPKPKVLFMGFGDSSLDFELRIWIRQIRRRFDVTSDINFSIDKAFRENGIEIPFPQRDLHVRSWSDAAALPGPRPVDGKEQDADD
jgi:small-conductance mechanosensitive channel